MHRVYNQSDIDILDTVACLNATGMRLEDMRKYIANASQGTVDAYDQVALLKTQHARLELEQKHITLRLAYVQLKIEYWKAYEQNNATRLQDILVRAKGLAQELKKV